MLCLALREGVAFAQTPPSPQEVEAGIRYVWPANLSDYGVGLARCESGLGSNSLTYVYGRDHIGPFQFSVVTWKPYFESLGYSWEQIVFDPYWNAWAAYQIYLRQGPGAWPNCP